MAQTRAPFHWKGTHDPLTTSLSHDIFLRSHTLFLDRKWSEISDVAISLGFFFFHQQSFSFFKWTYSYSNIDKINRSQKWCLVGHIRRKISFVRAFVSSSLVPFIHSLFAKLRQKFFFGRKRDEFGKLLSSRNCNFADSRVTISSGWNLSFFSFFFYGFPLIS